MAFEIETVRIAASHESQGAFVLINKADFDPAVHQLYQDPVEADPAVASEAAPAKKSKAK